MAIHISNPGFWGVVIFLLIVGGGLIKFGVAHSYWVGAAWKVCLGCGVFLVVVGAGLAIWAPFATKWGVVTFASPEPEGTKIETSVETAPRLPYIDERAIVNPEPAGNLIEEWDTLTPSERQEKFKELLDEPGTRVWTKPAGSDEPKWFQWKDLLPEDKQSVLELIPELTPRHEF